MTSFVLPADSRPVSGSWETMSFPSLVRWMSVSAASSPRSQASLYEASVFSGASCDSPRWATNSGGLAIDRETMRMTSASGAMTNWFMAAFLAGGLDVVTHDAGAGHGAATELDVAALI